MSLYPLSTNLRPPLADFVWLNLWSLGPHPPIRVMTSLIPTELHWVNASSQANTLSCSISCVQTGGVTALP